MAGSRDSLSVKVHAFCGAQRRPRTYQIPELLSVTIAFAISCSTFAFRRLPKLLYPLLTGGINATSSPGWIIRPSLGLVASSFDVVLDMSFAMSTYSRLIVTAQLWSTFLPIPGYRPSKVGKSLSNGNGADISSEDRPVKLEAEAK